MEQHTAHRHHSSPQPNAERTRTILHRSLWIFDIALVLAVAAVIVWPGQPAWSWMSSVLPSAITLRIVLSVRERRSRRNPGSDEPRRRERIGLGIVLPWRTSKALFKTGTAETGRDRQLERIAFWRSAAGLLTVTVATRGYRSTWENIGEALEKARTNALYAMCAAPLVLAVLYFATHPEFRHRLRSGIRSLLKRLGFFVISIAPIFGAFVGGFFLLPDSGPQGQPAELTEPWQGWLLGALILLAIWGSVYVSCTIYWAARTCFWTSAVHPLFAPAGSALLAAVVFAVELAEGLAAETPAERFDGVPTPIWLTLNLFGVATTLLLAVAEYRHIRGKGIGWTTGPDPAFAARS